MAGPVTTARAVLAEWLVHLAQERRASPRTAISTWREVTSPRPRAA